jgi:hypothetical protein
MDWIDHQRIRENLKELSDKSYQERVWTASAGPEISSFAEATCQLYGDSGLGDAYSKGHQVYGEKIDNLLKDFRMTLREFPDKRPRREVIEDKNMIPIRKMAAHILNLIELEDKKKPA